MECDEEFLKSHERMNNFSPPKHSQCPRQGDKTTTVTHRKKLFTPTMSSQQSANSNTQCTMNNKHNDIRYSMNSTSQCTEIQQPSNSYSIFRRPQVSILSEYKVNRKAGRNHFHRYSDVIVNERKKTTTTYDKLLNQKSSLESSSGWRLYYLSSQFDDLAQLENDLRESLVLCKNEIPSPNIQSGECMGANTDEVDWRGSEDTQLQFLHELLHGNLLRCQHSIEQLQEAKQSMFTLLKHKQKFTEIRRKSFELTDVKEKGPS